jgi:hypothetical protein
VNADTQYLSTPEGKAWYEKSLAMGMTPTAIYWLLDNIDAAKELNESSKPCGGCGVEASKAKAMLYIRHWNMCKLCADCTARLKGGDEKLRGEIELKLYCQKWGRVPEEIAHPMSDEEATANVLEDISDQLGGIVALVRPRDPELAHQAKFISNNPSSWEKCAAFARSQGFSIEDVSTTSWPPRLSHHPLTVAFSWVFDTPLKERTQ